MTDSPSNGKSVQAADLTQETLFPLSLGNNTSSSLTYRQEDLKAQESRLRIEEADKATERELAKAKGLQKIKQENLNSILSAIGVSLLVVVVILVVSGCAWVVAHDGKKQEPCPNEPSKLCYSSEDLFSSDFKQSVFTAGIGLLTGTIGLFIGTKVGKEKKIQENK